MDLNLQATPKRELLMTQDSQKHPGVERMINPRKNFEGKNIHSNYQVQGKKYSKGI